MSKTYWKPEQPPPLTATRERRALRLAFEDDGDATIGVVGDDDCHGCV